MIITVLACAYITILCLVWGKLLLIFFSKITGLAEFPAIHSSIVCFLGLAGITSFASILSLFMPLGGWLPQLLILLPCILIFFQKQVKLTIPAFNCFFSKERIVFSLLFCACTVLVLFLGSWCINNEDTLDYHAQIIQWIKEYKVVPGIAQLHPRYGLQNSWFISCALFSFGFLKMEALTFINIAVLLWYFYFITGRIAGNYLDKKTVYSFAWLVLLLLSLWSYTQVRLAAASASPDFIAAIYTWLLFYLLIGSTFNNHPAIPALIIILGLFTVTLKLSTAPVIILAGYGAFRLIRLKKTRALIVCSVIGLVILSAFITRNIITSGYPLFPSSFPGIARVDWKLSESKARFIQNYVTAYARTKTTATPDAVEKSISMKASEWIPGWWENQPVADQSIIAIAVLSLLLLFLRIKKIMRSSPETKIALITALAGIIFWFTQAPDPRFGLGFIIALPGIVFFIYTGSHTLLQQPYWRKLFLPAVFLTIAGSGIYSIYRAKNFFSVSQLFSPMGIKPVSYKTIECGGIDIRIPGTVHGCGGSGIPCTYDECETFEPRGKTITDGFRTRGKN